jgi:CRP-like cAMP-binding protein/cytochrome P450
MTLSTAGSTARPASLAPAVAGLPLLGNAIGAAWDPVRFFARCHRDYGPVFRIRYPGRTLTMLAGVEANRLFALEGQRAFSAARTYARVSREMGTESYPNAQEGEAHREMRRMVGPSLSALAVEPFLPRLYGMVRERALSWAPSSVHSFSGAMGGLVADAVAVCTTNRPVGEELARGIDLWATMMGAVGVGGVLPEAALYIPPVQKARRRLARFLEAELRDHRAQGPGLHRTPDLLDALLAAAAQSPGLYDDAALLALAMVPSKNAGIYAFRLISFVMYELLRHAEILARVRAEVEEGFAERPPGLEELRAMPTLQSVILESLRLHPMALALPRVVAADLEFEGFHFPSGTLVYIAAPVTHFDAAFFPAPDTFDPERFSIERSEHRRPHVYAPFGLGAHSCAARGYSLTLASAVVAGLLHVADLRLEPEGYEIRRWAFPNPIPEARFDFRVSATRAAASAPAPARVREGLSNVVMDLSPERRERISAALEEVSFGAGETVFCQGDPPDRFYLLRRGEAEVWQDADGRTRRLAVLGPGDHFGEIGILQGVPRTATIKARTRVNLLALGRDAFNELVVDADLTRQELVGLMARRAMANTLGRALPDLDAAAVRRLAAVGTTRTFEPGETIVRQGDAADRFFLLVRGRVEVSVAAADGGAIVVATLQAVDFFGEAGILQRRPRNATVRAAAGPVTVLEIPAERFEEMVSGSAATREDLARVAGERLLALALAELG